MMFKIPFTAKFYKSYDVVNNLIVWRWWSIFVAITTRGEKAYVDGKLKLPFGYWLLWTRG